MPSSGVVFLPLSQIISLPQEVGKPYPRPPRISWPWRQFTTTTSSPPSWPDHPHITRTSGPALSQNPPRLHAIPHQALRRHQIIAYLSSKIIPMVLHSQEVAQVLHLDQSIRITPMPLHPHHNFPFSIQLLILTPLCDIVHCHIPLLHSFCLQYKTPICSNHRRIHPPPFLPHAPLPSHLSLLLRSC